MHIKTAPEITEVTTTAECLAVLFGVNRASVYKWRKEQNLPFESRNTYNLVDAMQWFIMHKLDGGGAETLKEQRHLLLEQQTETAELKNKILRGELISANHFKNTVLELGAMIVEVLEIAPSWCEDNEGRAEIRSRAADHRRHIERRIRDLAGAKPGGGHDSATTKAQRGAVGRQPSGTA